jgi:hypothetical protein
MRCAQLGLHDPFPGCWGFVKAGFAEPLSVNGSVLSAIQALKFDEINLNLFVQSLVHVDEIVLKDQKILDGTSIFGLHLAQDPFVKHSGMNV